jgi:hypothetical protein
VSSVCSRWGDPRCRPLGRDALQQQQDAEVAEWNSTLNDADTATATKGNCSAFAAFAVMQLNATEIGDQADRARGAGLIVVPVLAPWKCDESEGDFAHAAPGVRGAVRVADEQLTRDPAIERHGLAGAEGAHEGREFGNRGAEGQRA